MNNPDLLRNNRNFQVFLLSAITSDLGSLMATFGLSLSVLQSSQSPADFALVFMIGALAPVLFAPIAGPISDRFDRKKLLVSMDLVRGAAALLLLAYLALGLPPRPAVYVTTFVLMSCEAFFVPVLGSLLPAVVDKSQIVRANALVHGSKQSVLVLAPLAASMLYALGGIATVLVVVSVVYFAAIAIQLRFLQVPAPAPRSPRPLSPQVILGDFTAAARYLFARVRHGSLMLNGILSHLLLFPFVMVVVPFMLIQHFGGSSVELGMVQAAYGAGTLCAMPLSVRWEKWGSSRNLLVGLVGLLLPMGLYLLVFTPLDELLRTEAAARIVLFGAAGFATFLFFSYYLVHFVSFFQSEVPAEMRGRAQALLVLNHSLSRVLGFALAGGCMSLDWRFGYVVLVVAVLSKILVHLPFLRSESSDTLLRPRVGAQAE